MSRSRLRFLLSLAAVTGWVAVFAAAGAGAAEPPPSDPHFTPAGFFDIHVCTWPERPRFYKILFSTFRFNEVESIEVFDTQGRGLTQFSLERYKVVQREGKPEKRVFINDLPVPEGARDGWHTAQIRLRDDTRYTAKDYVIVSPMPWATKLSPGDGAENIEVPQELSWVPVPGAKHYQVIVRDLWGGGQVVLMSPVINEPRLKLPPGLLQPDSLYAWRVHARDVNEHELLGDFNHGSLSPEATFSTAPAAP